CAGRTCSSPPNRSWRPGRRPRKGDSAILPSWRLPGDGRRAMMSGCSCYCVPPAKGGLPMMRTCALLRSSGLVLVLAVCLLLTGCLRSKVTKENLAKITSGMSMEDVEKILGKGEKMGDGTGAATMVGVAVPVAAGAAGVERYVWESGDKKIYIS